MVESAKNGIDLLNLKASNLSNTPIYWSDKPSECVSLWVKLCHVMSM